MHGWVGCPKCGLYIQWKRDPAYAEMKWNRRKREPEWINPADAQPEASGKYLVVQRDDRSTKTVHLDAVTIRLWLADAGYWPRNPQEMPSTVIKWMPLPAMPEEVKNG